MLFLHIFIKIPCNFCFRKCLFFFIYIRFLLFCHFWEIHFANNSTNVQLFVHYLILLIFLKNHQDVSIYNNHWYYLGFRSLVFPSFPLAFHQCLCKVYNFITIHEIFNRIRHNTDCLLSYCAIIHSFTHLYCLSCPYANKFYSHMKLVLYLNINFSHSFLDLKCLCIFQLLLNHLFHVFLSGNKKQINSYFLPLFLPFYHSFLFSVSLFSPRFSSLSHWRSCSFCLEFPLANASSLPTPVLLSFPFILILCHTFSPYFPLSNSYFPCIFPHLLSPLNYSCPFHPFSRFLLWFVFLPFPGLLVFKFALFFASSFFLW